jgi:FIST N domain
MTFGMLTNTVLRGAFMRPDRWFAVEWPTRQRMRQSAAQLKMTRTFQFHGDRVLTDSVVAADIASTGPLGIGAQHGCRAVGEPTLVTGSSPNRVDSLDDRPTLDVFLEPIGTEPGQLRPEDLPSLALMHPLGLGRRRGEEQSGSGTTGLIGRMEALGGKRTLGGPAGEGTSLVIELALEPS